MGALLVKKSIVFKCVRCIPDCIVFRLAEVYCSRVGGSFRNIEAFLPRFFASERPAGEVIYGWPAHMFTPQSISSRLTTGMVWGKIFPLPMSLARQADLAFRNRRRDCVQEVLSMSVWRQGKTVRRLFTTSTRQSIHCWPKDRASRHSDDLPSMKPMDWARSHWLLRCGHFHWRKLSMGRLAQW